MKFIKKIFPVPNRKTGLALAFFLGSLLLISWMYQESTSIEKLFHSGKKISYEIRIHQGDSSYIADTLQLTIKKKGILGSVLNMNMSIWHSSRYPEYKEKRGINIEPASIRLQMPFNIPYLEHEKILLAPYPSWDVNTKLKSTYELARKLSPNSGELGSKNIQQIRYVLDSTSCENNSAVCMTMEGKNTSLMEEYGEYKVTYQYNTGKGFTQIDYTYPTGKKIFFTLVE
jgi:hypothetical protein